MSTGSFEALARAVVAASVASRWAPAVLEWAVTGVRHDHSASGICVCGQTGLVSLFTIRNERNGAELFPIGSVCVNKFGRADLDQQVELLDRLLSLRSAVLAGEQIELTSQHFSRAMLGYLYDEGAFTPDRWNRGDGGNDYDFLLKMFNKRNKDEVTRRQRNKITMLLKTKVFPFVRTDNRLR